MPSDRQASSAATLQEQVVDEARNTLRRMDEARAWNVEHGRPNVVKEIDFAIGATLSLRSAVQDYDKAMGRG